MKRTPSPANYARLAAVMTLTLVVATPCLAADVELVRERFPDGSVKIERQVTLDTHGNYVNHGRWKEFNEAGKLLAEGQYDMGRRTGLWTQWHDRQTTLSLREPPFNEFQNPFVSQATFRDNRLDGNWAIFDANGEKCCEIGFRNGLRQGAALMWLPGGSVYRAAVYEQGLLTGNLRHRNAEGELAVVGTYVAGRPVQQKVTLFPGSEDKQSEASYLGPQLVASTSDDFRTLRFANYQEQGATQRHGTWRLWHAPGQPHLEGQYADDLEIGTFTWWHTNGQKAVAGEYLQGQQHGEWTWWHANGQKATIGNFEQGAQVGLWRKWGSGGQLVSQVTFDQHGRPQAEPVVRNEAPGEAQPQQEAARRPQEGELR